MKSGSKVLIGVLSVAALVGTGVATWTVGGGYHEKETVTITPEIATIGSRDVDLDVVIDDDEGDHPIRFDNPTLQDLSVTYHVTGKKGADAADDFNPFTYNYSTVASEYQPNLSWETTVYRDGSPVGKDDAFFDYVVAPKGEMKYSDWLISGGIDVPLIFEWSEEILGGLNPQTYIDQHIAQYPTKDAQTEFFTKLNEALDVTFKFTFKVGGLTETPIETPTTGEVTLPTVENSTLSIEGMTGNTIPAGEHTITITTNEGYVLTDNKLSVIENGETKEVTMTENSLTRAASHTYTRKYDFKENATYRFDYAVEEGTVVTPVEKYAVTFTQPENGTITVTSGETSLTSGALVDENTEVTYVVTPSEGYHIASITVNGKAVEEFDNTSYTGTVTVTSATSISATMEADTPAIEYTKISDLIAIGDGSFSEVTVKATVVAVTKSGYGISDDTAIMQVFNYDLANQYKIGDVLEIKGTPKYFNGSVEFTNTADYKLLEEKDEVTPNTMDVTGADFNSGIDSLLYKHIRITLRAEISGKYTNFYANDLTKYSNFSLIDYDYTFEDGKNYTIEGYVAYLNNGKYIYLYATHVEAAADSEYVTLNSISEMISGGTYIVNGEVAALTTKGMIVDDGTAGVYVYLNKAPNYTVGQEVSIKGSVSAYNGLLQFGEDSEITLLDTNDFTTTVPTELTKEIAVSWASESLAQTTVKPYTWTSTITKDGNFFIANLDDANITIEPSYIPSNFSLKEGSSYRITAYFGGYSTSHEYAAVYLTDVKEITPTYDSVESVVITNTDTELEVGKTLQLTSKVLPETANQEVTYEVTSGSEYAKVSETGLVTAEAEGEVTITVTTKGLNSSEQTVTDTINLNIIAATVTDVFTSAGIYKYDVRLNEGSYSADKAELIEVLKVGDEDSSNQIVSATIIDKVYSDTTYEGIKLSSSKVNGSFSITTKDDIYKIKVGIIGWTESGIGLSIDNGIDAAVTYSLDGEGDKTTVTYFKFEFENASKNFTFTATKRLAIAYLEFFTK